MRLNIIFAQCLWNQFPPTFRPLPRLCWGAWRARQIKSLPIQGRPWLRRAASTIALSCEKCFHFSGTYYNTFLSVVILLGNGWTRRSNSCNILVDFGTLVFFFTWLCLEICISARSCIRNGYNKRSCCRCRCNYFLPCTCAHRSRRCSRSYFGFQRQFQRHMNCQGVGFQKI